MQFGLELTRKNKDFVRTSPVLLITGDGKLLKDDLERFDGYGITADKLAIGRSIQAVEPPILHYADVDADAGKWVAENLEAQYPDKVKDDSIIRHTLGAEDDAPWFDYIWDIVGNPWPSEEVLWHGSTSLFAVLAGLGMGYDRIILAGCPLDSKGHWYFPNQKWGPRWTMETYQVWFEFAATGTANKVRSLSGYTKQLLGEPSRGWINEYP